MRDSKGLDHDKISAILGSTMRPCQGRFGGFAAPMMAREYLAMKAKQERPMTTVISVRGRDRATLEADPSFVYVGRKVGRGRNFKWSSSDWGNPFKVGMPIAEAVRMIDEWGQRRHIDRDIVCMFDEPALDVEVAVELYRSYVLACPVLRDRLGELAGKTLGCWCGCWKPGEPEIHCHAVVLAKLAEASPAGDNR